jgi:hypothetical protein
MRPALKSTLAACIGAALAAGCASTAPPAAPSIVRTRPPVNYVQAIGTYFDASIAGSQKDRQLNIGKPEPGGCPMGGYANSERGWVVPVVYATRSGQLGRDTITISSKEYYFWFRQDTISGITTRMELCP